MEYLISYNCVYYLWVFLIFLEIINIRLCCILNTIMTTTQFFEKYTSHFIWKGCVWEGVGVRTKQQHIDPHSYGHQHFFPVLLGCSTGGLGPILAGWWFSLPRLISNCSGLQNSLSGAWGLPLLGAGFLYRILSATLLIPKNSLNFLCTELYNSSTPSQYLPITGHGNMHLRHPWNGMFGWVGGQYTTIGILDIV